MSYVDYYRYGCNSRVFLCILKGRGGIADTMRKKYCYSQLFQHNCVTDSFISRQQFMVLSILKLRVFPMK